MSRRNQPRPRHESPHEQRLREIVDELVPDDSQKQAYVLFARELAAAERASFFVRRSTSDVPDYSRRTKRVVMKWFRRGLSGHSMRLVGEAVLGKARITKLE
jgi:hypothetical protein